MSKKDINKLHDLLMECDAEYSVLCLSFSVTFTFNHLSNILLKRIFEDIPSADICIKDGQAEIIISY